MGINTPSSSETSKSGDDKKKDTSAVDKAKEKVKQSVHDTLNPKK